MLDTTSGETLLTLAGYESASRSLDWSPDGATILTGHEDGTARLWDAHSGMERATLTGHTGVVLDGVFSPDGSLISPGKNRLTVEITPIETDRDKARGEPIAKTVWPTCRDSEFPRAATTILPSLARSHF